MTHATRWGTDFDPDRLAALETRMWKAYYRRQPARLFGPLIDALQEQARVSWPRALAASLLLTRAAAGFARATGDYERFAPDIGRGYRLLGLPRPCRCRGGRPPRAALVGRPPRDRAGGRRRGRRVDHRPVRGALRRPARARGGGRPAARTRGGDPRSRRDRRPGRSARCRASAYWPEVARLLRASYRSLETGLAPKRRCAHRQRRPRRGLPPSGRPGDGRPATRRSGRVPPRPPAWPRPRR